MEMLTLAGTLILFAVGVWSWGFVEYLIHGFLSHRWRTPISPLHWSHHQEPNNVFTTPFLWIPISVLLWLVISLGVGWYLASVFMSGLLLGFLHYEYVHWRIHFREPKTEKQRQLRAHHMAHHYVNTRDYHGVTTTFWDKVFGTFPEDWYEGYRKVADVPVSNDVSNFRDAYSYSGFLQVLHTLLGKKEIEN